MERGGNLWKASLSPSLHPLLLTSEGLSAYVPQHLRRLFHVFDLNELRCGLDAIVCLNHI